MDYWMSFPAEGRDPRFAYDDPGALQDSLIPNYQLNTSVWRTQRCLRQRA